MRQGTSKKILIVVLVILITLLIGVSIFIATRLQQTQAPSDSSAATRVVGCEWCEGFGDATAGCPSPAQKNSPYCNSGGQLNNCCIFRTEDDGTGGGGGGGVDPNTTCVITYAGSSINFSKGCAGKSLQYFHTSYDGVNNRCPTTENGEATFTVGSNGGSYSASPAAGECRQLDHHFSGVGPNGGTVGDGGVCACNPPQVTPKYKCSNNACVRDDAGGTFTGSDCNNSCSTTSTTAQCNEACSATVPCETGLSCTSGVCRLPANPTSATCLPASVSVTAASVCPSGATSPTATITWSPSTTIPTEIQIDTDNNWTNGYYRKTSLSGTSTTAPAGFTGTAGVSGSLTMTSSTTYYVRAYHQSTNTYTTVVNFTGATCTIETAIQCIDLRENGSDPLATGTGNFVIYTLVYQNGAATDPYPNIRLRVGTSGSPVGRDANSTSSALVRTFKVTHDSVNKRWSYQFKWEAATTAGANVPAGTYNVRALLDGTTDVTSPAACLETITLSQTAVEEPLFTILKQGAPVCQENGDSVVNYTVTITNIGSVPGTIDFVQDTYDTQIYGLGILPTSVAPSYGSVNTGKITWTGDNAQRTFTAGQAKTFTYSIRVPEESVATFATTGLYNQALVQYDTSTTSNNTASFDLRTFLSCTIIPNTGILDDSKFIMIGLFFIILGILVFKFGIGSQLSMFVLSKTSGTLSKGKKELVRKVMPYEESIMDDMENKRKK